MIREGRLNNPFYVAAALYFALDAIAFAALALANAGLIPVIPGLVWLRVHLLTIGVVTQVVVGTLPRLVSTRLESPIRASRRDWAAWTVTNCSLILLIVGMPRGLSLLAIVGALGVFAAIVLMLSGYRLSREVTSSLPFYIAGPVFFLAGIVFAIALLRGWPSPGGFPGLVEAHIHANVWGFLGLVVAGVQLESLPVRVNSPLAYPALVGPIFWLLTVGAASLVVGPWLGLAPPTMIGMALYLAGTVLLVINLAGTVRASGLWCPELAHRLVAYVWLAVPAFVAPAVVLTTGRLPDGRIEAAAISSVVAGWLLQILIAAWPERAASDRGLSLAAGPWWPLLALNIGVLGIWLVGLGPEWIANLVGLPAYALVIAAWLPALAQLGRIMFRPVPEARGATQRPVPTSHV